MNQEVGVGLAALPIISSDPFEELVFPISETLGLPGLEVLVPGIGALLLSGVMVSVLLNLKQKLPSGQRRLLMPMDHPATKRLSYWSGN